MINPSKLTKMEEEEEKDRISKLPDEILHLILSKVDIQEAVKTSILSKRWTNLWPSLPYLTFDFSRPAYQTTIGGAAWLRFMPHFTNLVTQFLTNRNNTSAVQTLYLRSSKIATDATFVQKCLNYALNHGVEHLNINVYCYPTPLEFPVGLFACRTLRELKLRQYTSSTVVPKPFILPNLETLHLECFSFDDYDVYSFPKEPFSSFPNLNKLTLHRCEISNMIISAAKLRVLEISFHDPLFSREMIVQEVSTPNLTSFRCESFHVSLAFSKVVTGFPKLEEVYYDVCPYLESPYTDDVEKKIPMNTVRMLQQLGNAKFVVLTLGTIEVLEMDVHLLEESPSPFHQIQSLEIRKGGGYSNYLKKTVSPIVMNYLAKGSKVVLKRPTL